MEQANAHDARGPIAGSAVGLLTGGLAGVWPFGNDQWRLQGTAAGDLPIDGLGRNHTMGIGLTAALVRLWM
jgi:hypothetical protein